MFALNWVKKAFAYFDPQTWNYLQSTLHLKTLVPLDHVKAMLTDHLTETT